ncbi:MAG: HK97 family phage prohead protease [Candidatus Paracaedimonas acanthamoebae]|mgnify:FL=1|uniref:HK97 family phage prohead protease n=1 Tax=Candidatus Paracaedimonas acanthamoebae TaxID=244581 RepID=A0A8J7PTR9_9PROT|nr:HK97 family phage prohead protease [Candidatus Paracaedimonas acanthamoebae]
MKLNKISYPIELKYLEEEGVFEGYASVFEHLDDHGVRVMKGAFMDSLRHWWHSGQVPKMLWQHDPSQPIGVWESLEEDGHGLRVKGRLLLDVQRGLEAYTLMKAGVLDSLSIGYRVLEARPGKKSGERLLSKLELHEISLVTFPANDRAKITQVKNLFTQESEMIQRIYALVSLLKDWSL